MLLSRGGRKGGITFKKNKIGERGVGKRRRAVRKRVVRTHKENKLEKTFKKAKEDENAALEKRSVGKFGEKKKKRGRGVGKRRHEVRKRVVRTRRKKKLGKMLLGRGGRKGWHG